MAEFNLDLEIDSDDLDSEALEQLLGAYVEAFGSVEFVEGDSVVVSNDGTLEATLAIDDVDDYVEIYRSFRDSDDPFDIGTWGPTAERFPVPVQHYALQQISAPDRYEYYALDDRVTLVICDQYQQVEQLRMEVPPPALG